MAAFLKAHPAAVPLAVGTGGLPLGDLFQRTAAALLPPFTPVDPRT
jgi:hypothetical protein